VKRVVGTLICVLAVLVPASVAAAATLQPVGNFNKPIYVTSDPGNGERLFVVEREGQIISVENGVQSEFADLRSVVGCCEGEGGLLSIALSPDFDTSGRIFVDYVDRAKPGAIHVAELRASGASAPISTLRNLLTIEHPSFSNHYGGQLQFGPEGLLYISTGDGGGGNDVQHNAQSKASLLGKILRLEINPGGGLEYTVPSGNPFPELTAPFSTIFSYGLRNPYRFSFDRLSHDLVIGDVGEGSREEIDWAPAPGLGGGANYGWNCMEGTLPGPATDPECKTAPLSGFVPPTFEYSHEAVGGGTKPCAVIGGYVVRDASLGSLYGRYLYGDLCTGEVRSLLLGEPATSDRSESLPVENLNSFGEDPCGRVYTVSGNGTVSRLVGTTPAPCGSPITVTPAPKSPTTIGLRAVTRRVRKNGRAQITAWVTPCAGRHGEPVRLMLGKRKLGTRRLDRACTARFLPRIHHNVKFRVAIHEDPKYLAATSRKLSLHVFHPKNGEKRHHTRIHIPVGVGHR
jgi:glucose/arabinose dehydrogenase